MRYSQRHDSNGNRSTIHIDRCTKGNAHRVEFFVKSQFLTQIHIDGDVSCRWAGEESLQATLLQTGKQQWIGIATKQEDGDKRIKDKGIGQHTTHEQQVSRFVKTSVSAPGAEIPTTSRNWSVTENKKLPITAHIAAINVLNR